MSGQSPLVRIGLTCAAILIASAIVGSQLASTGTMTRVVSTVADEEDEAAVYDSREEEQEEVADTSDEAADEYAYEDDYAADDNGSNYTEEAWDGAAYEEPR